MTYYEIMTGIHNIFDFRLNMIKYAEKMGISAAAREYKTTRRTVSKWVKRYTKEGLNGLKDRSRAPHHIPHKTPKEIEDMVIELRKTHPAWGPERLKMHYDLSISTKAIGRIIRQAGLVRKKKKKWRKQRDLREKKKALKALSYIQIDTKDLSDIEKYWPQMRKLNLPRYEYTARDVRTGGTWYAYGESNNSSNATLFAGYLLGQLKHYGMNPEDVIIQTDNGSEFIGSVTKKNKSAFEKVLKKFNVKYNRIPPSSPTWNSDVETFHGMVEDELYDIEDYREIEEFRAKAYAYQLYFNFKRKNRYKGRKTPVELLKEIKGEEISPQVFNFPPIILDDLLEEIPEGDNLVGLSVISWFLFP